MAYRLALQPGLVGPTMRPCLATAFRRPLPAPSTPAIARTFGTRRTAQEDSKLQEEQERPFACRRSSNVSRTSAIEQQHGGLGLRPSRPRIQLSPTLHDWHVHNTFPRGAEAVRPFSIFARGQDPVRATGVELSLPLLQLRRRFATLPDAVKNPAELKAALSPPSKRKRFLRRFGFFLAVTFFLASVYGLLASFFPPLRWPIIGIVRCTRVAIAVGGAIVDYKLLFRKTWPDTEEGKKQRHEDYEATHLSAAHRILAVLRKNGGIYVKLGQHLSSVQLIPPAWSQTMRPLQDQCFPTPYDEMNELFVSDVGAPISDLFSSFDRDPIGVASLAQVHKAVDRKTGTPVAVKVMHPSLEEYCEVDMRTVVVMLRVVKWVFPTFEFTWLGEEMRENLPKEMDFRHEADMARRCREDFAPLRHTALRIPDVLWAKKRVLVMEFIEGARVDDLQFLADHKIDRNRVSQELSRIFSQMLYINGFFHADPHGGNLLIRPAPHGSRSPFNFEIVLLDHGLYFDLDKDLRVNYARLWLSFIKSSSPQVVEERKKYAEAVGHISPDQYPIFETAITGRTTLDGDSGDGGSGDVGGSILDMATQSKEEQHRIRMAVVEEGLVTSIFEILRTVPRRILMVNDLTRSLDASLRTTHSPARIWVIVARFCGLAVYEDDREKLQARRAKDGLSFRLMRDWVGAWLNYQRWYNGLRFVEWSMDAYAGFAKLRLWIRGLLHHGLGGARREAAGLEA